MPAMSVTPESTEVRVAASGKIWMDRLRSQPASWARQLSTRLVQVGHTTEVSLGGAACGSGAASSTTDIAALLSRYDINDQGHLLGRNRPAALAVDDRDLSVGAVIHSWLTARVLNPLRG